MSDRGLSRREMAGWAAAATLAATSVRPAGAQTPSLPWHDVTASPYNAAGNGTTDDTTAIQDAVNAAATTPRGGVVLLPPGVFRITGPINFPPGIPVDLVGAGRWQSQILCDHTQAGLRFGTLGGASGSSTGVTGGFWVRGSSTPSNRPGVAMNVAVSSNRTFYDIQITDAAVTGLAVERCQNALFEQLFIQRCPFGLVLDRGAGGNTFTAIQLRNNVTNLLLQASDPTQGEPYGGRPTDNKFFGGIIEGGTGEQTTLQVDHASGVENYFVGVRFGGNGPKIRFRNVAGWQPSHDLFLIGCFFVGGRTAGGDLTGSGIEHTARWSTIWMTRCKFQSLSPAFTLGNGCFVELDTYHAIDVATRFANASGGSDAEELLIRREVFHPHNTTAAQGTGTALRTWVGTGIGNAREANPRFRLRASGEMSWGPGSAALDATLTRAASGRLRLDGRFVATDGIGVGNSQAASTLGSVVRRIQVFDADGNALGYVPVYGAIT